MKEKAKKILGTIFLQGLGVACDLALIHNFIYRDRSDHAGWSLYCQRYITMFTWFSWFLLICSFLIYVYLAVAVSREDFRKKNAETLKKMAKDFKPKLWKILWRWLESVPMIFFTAIFAGNMHLAMLWLFTTIFSALCEQSAVKLDGLLNGPPKPPQSFSDVMAELDKKASQN